MLLFGFLLYFSHSKRSLLKPIYIVKLFVYIYVYIYRLHILHILAKAGQLQVQKLAEKFKIRIFFQMF